MWNLIINLQIVHFIFLSDYKIRMYIFYYYKKIVSYWIGYNLNDLISQIDNINIIDVNGIETSATSAIIGAQLNWTESEIDWVSNHEQIDVNQLIINLLEKSELMPNIIISWFH